MQPKSAKQMSGEMTPLAILISPMMITTALSHVIGILDVDMD